ncbi:hypothetical protein BpHYR1_024270 [Brachionus plicatilis]|uniref:Uncharacterized protein n=1 Tax=Brachionus plicatilis TaxID=10195 RepID=A0A3M7PQJ3_BRAPC|nr:hypothetical protein BpHYR1_024270 [Brachionus plicatilis]
MNKKFVLNSVFFESCSCCNVCLSFGRLISRRGYGFFWEIIFLCRHYFCLVYMRNCHTLNLSRLNEHQASVPSLKYDANYIIIAFLNKFKFKKGLLKKQKILDHLTFANKVN